jgi:hypothetical protein
MHSRALCRAARANRAWRLMELGQERRAEGCLWAARDLAAESFLLRPSRAALALFCVSARPSSRPRPAGP